MALFTQIYFLCMLYKDSLTIIKSNFLSAGIFLPLSFVGKMDINFQSLIILLQRRQSRIITLPPYLFQLCAHKIKIYNKKTF